MGGDLDIETSLVVLFVFFRRYRESSLLIHSYPSLGLLANMHDTLSIDGEFLTRRESRQWRYQNVDGCVRFGIANLEPTFVLSYLSSYLIRIPSAQTTFSSTTTSTFPTTMEFQGNSKIANDGHTTFHNNPNTHDYNVNDAAKVMHGNTTNNTLNQSPGKSVNNNQNANTDKGGNHISGTVDGELNSDVNDQHIGIQQQQQQLPSHIHALNTLFNTILAYHQA
ncbi:hypothetical protein BDN72DRAFT_862829 [Pluteus cervinus]|uniref:Uncharacterized protein n=1 Tax=Pluteus cervinus TaxID=181527 RepID=A0ACD3AA10_9AGAR|nr:hypothetical protein BDN72DRAFT_862829 [Pluteus cervinus]